MRVLRNLFLPTYANNYKAYLISNKALVFYTLLLLVVNVFFSGASVQRTYALVDEQAIARLHNVERRKHGLGDLTFNYTLQRSAKAKGEVMLENDCWSHYCPTGTSPWKFFKDEGYSYTYAGENLAEGFSNSEAIMQAWMNSQSHRENVLKPEFTEVGVAIVTGDYQGIDSNIIVIVHFGTPKNSVEKASTPILEPTPAPSQETSQGEGAPQITYPESGGVTNDTTLKIEGEYEGAVDIDLDGSRSGRVSSDGGIFIYEPEEPLSEGVHGLSVSDFGNSEISSPKLNFTIDLTAPEILTSEPTAGDSYELTLDFSEDISLATASSELGNDDYLSLEKINTDTWKLALKPPNDEMSGVALADYFGDITLTVTDLAGNENNQTISKQQVLGITELAGGLETLPNTGGMFVSSVQRFLQLTGLQLIALIAVIFLLMLFAVDYLVITKTDLKVATSHRSNSHLHIPALALIVLIIIMGGAGGAI